MNRAPAWDWSQTDNDNDDSQNSNSCKQQLSTNPTHVKMLGEIDFNDSVASCIIPNLLFLGGEDHAADIEQLAKLNIKVTIMY
jgi:hypothetical protein